MALAKLTEPCGSRRSGTPTSTLAALTARSSSQRSRRSAPRSTLRSGPSSCITSSHPDSPRFARARARWTAPQTAGARDLAGRRAGCQPVRMSDARKVAEDVALDQCRVALELGEVPLNEREHPARSCLLAGRDAQGPDRSDLR